MDWREDFHRRIVSAEEAVKAIKPGSRVAFTQGIEPLTISLELVARSDEFKGIELFIRAPGRDLPWFEPGWEDSFSIEVAHALPVCLPAIAARRCDYVVGDVFWRHYWDTEETDFLITEVSPPDEHGFCSFGASSWNKKEQIKAAKVAIAQINPNFIRTYGDNFIHYSEIDYFVEYVPTGRSPGGTDLLGRRTTGPGEMEKTIAEYVGTVIKDGDTLQIGVGGTAEWVVPLGGLNNKVDLGWHSENTPKGIATLVREGVITGKHKAIHPGKAVATAVGGGTQEEMDFINMNPLFEVYGSDYILDPRIISVHENMVAINSALAVDLTGQIGAESLGPTMIGGTGGQLAFAIGASLSQGGRFITVLSSTARKGNVSRIVPQFELGTVVTIPRTLADIVISEYGIARLKGKTQRQRAQELINIAHPDFRAELNKEAQRLFWP